MRCLPYVCTIHLNYHHISRRKSTADHWLFPQTSSCLCQKELEATANRITAPDLPLVDLVGESLTVRQLQKQSIRKRRYTKFPPNFLNLRTLHILKFSEDHDIQEFFKIKFVNIDVPIADNVFDTNIWNVFFLNQLFSDISPVLIA